jgi:hypothetical protein
MPADARIDEIEAELRRMLAETMPEGSPPPALVDLKAGSLFFSPEDAG